MLEVKSLKSGYQKVGFFLRLWVHLFHASLSFWWFARNLRCSLAGRSMILIFKWHSPCVCLALKFPFCQESTMLDCQPFLNLIICKVYFQMKSHTYVLEVRTSTSFGGDTIQLITLTQSIINKLKPYRYYLM